MVEWLEERPDGPSNVDIWGQDKPYYNFTDLTKWLQIKAEGEDESLSENGKRNRKKTSKKMRRSSSPQPSHGKKSHKAKAKSSGMMKKGSKK